MGRTADRLNIQGRTSQRLGISEQAEPKRVGFLEGVKQDLQQRGKRLGEIADVTKIPGQSNIGKTQGFASGILQTAGEGAGGFLDIVGRGVSKAIPDVVEKPIIKAISSVAQTKTVQDAISVYQNFKQKHPEAAENVESGLNLLIALGLPKASKESLKTTGHVSGKLGSGIEKSGLKSLEREKQSFARRLTRPLETKAVREAEVARTTEKGFGPFKRSVVSPTGSEARAQKAVLEIPGISPKKTYQQNYNIIKEYNTKLALELKKDLTTHDVPFVRRELVARLKETKKSLAQSPALVGDQVKIADKLIVELQRRIAKSPAKASSLLETRKNFDNWVKSQKPKVFDASSENAFTITNREIRNTVNTFLDEKVTKVAVKESLKKQSALFDAIETIAPKAAQEANTAIGRSFQRMMLAVGLKNKLVQQIAAIVGIGGLGAAATFAPAAAITGVGAFLIFKGGKLILKPQIRVYLGRLLQLYEKTAGKAAALEIKRNVNKAIGDQVIP